MKTIIIIAVIVLLVILIIGWVIGTQNSLVVLEENVKNALSQIDVNLTSRFDALGSLLEVVKGYAKHEHDTLADVIASRRTGHSLEDVKANENMLTEAMGKLMVVQEQYPNLKADTQFTSLMNSINDYENKVRTTRQVYNDSVTKFNRKVMMIPSCFIAGMLGFTKKEYFETDNKHKEMPSMKMV